METEDHSSSRATVVTDRCVLLNWFIYCYVPHGRNVTW